MASRLFTLSGRDRGGRLALALVSVLALSVAFAATAVAKNLGEWTQGDVDNGVASGVAFLDASANKSDPAHIHWTAADSSNDITQTGFAIAAIGAAVQINPADVTAGQLADARNAVQWLIGQQTTAPGDTQGSWEGSNYATSIALMALSFFPDEPGAAGSIASGRNFEIAWQQAPPSATGNPGSSCTASSGSSYGTCGAWTYSPGPGCGSCGDASNTGFGVTGLDFSGGVPAGTAAANLGWTRAIQELDSNPFHSTGYNDGGGSYQPGEGGGSFTSNANDTGTDLFSYAYDGAPDTDAGVVASIKQATNVLDTYELDKANVPRVMVYHSPPPPGNEDGSCAPGAPGCDWFHATGEGGYHYSLFALSKGLGSYIAPDLAASGNFYPKVVDLLLSEQDGAGSWHADLRDDGSVVGATSFAILALTKAGQKKAVPPAVVAAPPAAVLPAAVPCVDKRRFKFRLHHAPHQRVVKVKVFVNKKLKKTVRRHNVRTVAIAALPQQRFVVKIVAYQSSGSRLESTRTYKGCNKSRPKTRAHHHRHRGHKH
jgi:hypothetical protein